MEASGILACVGFVAAFFAAACLVPFFFEGAMSLRRAARAQSYVIDGPSQEADASMGMGEGGKRLLRNGVPLFFPLAHALGRIPALSGLVEDVAWFCRSKGIEVSDASVASVLIAGGIATGTVGGVIASSAVFGIVAALCLIMGIVLVARRGKEKERDSVREGIPEVLRSMSSCFHSGYTLLQTFRQLAEETQGPLQRCFREAESDLEMGKTADEALEGLRRSSSTPELAFVTVALEVQHRTGGSLRQIIDTACDSVEGELELKRSLRVQTAQARLSARVVTALPFVLIAALSLMTSDFLAPFFSSAFGFAILCLALTMQVAGVLCVRRLLDVGEG